MVRAGKDITALVKQAIELIPESIPLQNRGYFQVYDIGFGCLAKVYTEENTECPVTPRVLDLDSHDAIRTSAAWEYRLGVRLRIEGLVPEYYGLTPLTVRLTHSKESHDYWCLFFQKMRDADSKGYNQLDVERRENAKEDFYAKVRDARRWGVIANKPNPTSNALYNARGEVTSFIDFGSWFLREDVQARRQTK